MNKYLYLSDDTVVSSLKYLYLSAETSISTSETDVNTKKFKRQSDEAIVGEGDSIYDSRPDNLKYNELDKDCLYMQP